MYKKGETVYYFTNYRPKYSTTIVFDLDEIDSDEINLGVIELEIIGEYTFLIKKIFTPTAWMGNKDRIIEGNKISANELQGVGYAGIDNYIFDKYKIIEKILEA